MKVSAIIAAGGTGSRLGVQGGKQLLELNGKPILVHTLEKIAPLVDEVIVVIDDSQLKACQDILEKNYILCERNNREFRNKMVKPVNAFKNTRNFK